MTGAPGQKKRSDFARLTKRQEFMALRNGARHQGKSFIVQARIRQDAQTRGEQTSTTEDASPRFGLTITKKTGNSVVRNRIRRRLREVIRQNALAAAPGHDYVLVGKRNALTEKFHALGEQFVTGIGKTNAALGSKRHSSGMQGRKPRQGDQPGQRQN